MAEIDFFFWGGGGIFGKRETIRTFFLGGFFSEQGRGGDHKVKREREREREIRERFMIEELKGLKRYILCFSYLCIHLFIFIFVVVL